MVLQPYEADEIRALLWELRAILRRDDQLDDDLEQAIRDSLSLLGADNDDTDS